MPLDRTTYSGFLRGPSDVLARLERGDVLLERRDGEDLVLTTARRAAASQEGLAVGATALRHLALTHPDMVAEQLEYALPWMSWLPVDDRRACVRELLDDLAASVDVGDFARFHQDVTAWRHTAEVWSDPNLAARLQADVVGDGGEVARPGSAG